MHRYSRTTIDILPAETLLQIFELASKHIPEHYTRKKPASIAISCVCKKWRELALHYPLMWTNIYFPMFPNAYMLLYLDRSKNAEVDLTLSKTNRPEDPQGKRYARLANAVKENAHRIRSITIRKWRLREVEKFFSASRDTVFSVLKALDVTLSGGYKDTDTPMISSAPSLRTLKLYYMPFKCLPPFTQITHLDITDFEDISHMYFHHFSSTSLQDIYALCPNLKGIVLRYFESVSDGSFIHLESKPVEALHLESLAIGYRYASYNDVSYRGCTCDHAALIAPNLKYLELCNLPSTSSNLLSHILQLTNSCTDPSNLTVRLDCAQLSGCLEFLRGLPKSTKLELANVSSHELPEVFSLSNLSKITLDLHAIREDEWNSIFPPDFSPACPIKLHIPPPFSSHYSAVRLTERGNTILARLPKDNIAITQVPFSEGFIQTYKGDFFAKDEWENYSWDVSDRDSESTYEEPSGETPKRFDEDDYGYL